MGTKTRAKTKMRMRREARMVAKTTARATDKVVPGASPVRLYSREDDGSGRVV